MCKILLALLIFQAAVLAQNPAVEAVRSKLRPSLLEISKRVLSYSAEGDFQRASKAAEFLAPLSNELMKVNVIEKKFFIPMKPALEKKDLLLIRESLRRLILADIHFLLSHLADPPTKGGLTPRTRLLMAQQDLRFLQAGLPKDKHGKKVHLALDKLFQVLIQTVPHKSEYGGSHKRWSEHAGQTSNNILKLLDNEVLPKKIVREEK